MMCGVLPLTSMFWSGPLPRVVPRSGTAHREVFRLDPRPVIERNLFQPLYVTMTIVYGISNIRIPEGKTHFAARRTGVIEMHGICKLKMPQGVEQQIKVPIWFLRSAGYAPPGTASTGFDKLRSKNIGRGAKSNVISMTRVRLPRLS